MKSLLPKILFFFLCILSVFSCHKDKYVCTTCDVYENDIPPIAIAGSDIKISFNKQNCSYETVILDGSASSDPDGKINRYQWGVIAPFKQEIGQELQIYFSPPGQGDYLIQLQVTDDLGKVAFDTVRVTVINDFVKTIQDIPVNLSVITNIPSAYKNYNIIGGSETNILFQREFYDNDWEFIVTDKIAILDTKSKLWKEIKFSEGRDNFSTAVIGEKIFIAGGYHVINYGDPLSSKTVDIYDIASGNLTTTYLTDSRTGAGSEYFGSKVFFIGGTQYVGNREAKVLNNIEVYDTLTKIWSIIQLPLNSGNNYERVDNKLYFLDNALGESKRYIHIFNLENNSWSETESNLRFTRNAGIAVNKTIFWLGDRLNYSIQESRFGALTKFNTDNQTSTFTCLPDPVSNSGVILSANNKLLIYNPYQFIGNTDNMIGYMYNVSSEEWYRAKSAQIFPFRGIRQCGNEIFAMTNDIIYKVDF